MIYLNQKSIIYLKTIREYDIIIPNPDRFIPFFKLLLLLTIKNEYNQNTIFINILKLYDTINNRYNKEIHK